MKRTIAFAIGLSLVFAVLAACQGPVSPTYKLQPGDQLAVTVFNHPEYSLDKAQVTSDGFISMPAIGPVKVWGLTTNELSEHLQELLKHYLREPLVSVTVAEAHSLVYILGEVHNPGPKPWFSATSIQQAIAQAGGFSEFANRRTAVLLRADGSRREIDLSSLLSGKSNDTQLLSGDVLVIQRMQGVSALGEFRRSGTQFSPLPLTLSELVARTGGFTENADLDNITLLRNGNVVERIHWKPGKLNPAGNLQLQDGDLVYAPSRLNVASVFGQVGRVGSVAIHPGLKLSGLLAAAGGLKPNADRHKLILTRSDGSTQTIDYEALVEKGDKSLDVEIKPGDVLYVPEHLNQVFVLGEVSRPGAFLWVRGMSLMNIISLAGGVTSNADLEGAQLIHKGKTKETVNLHALLKENKLDADKLLEPGDVVLVPRLVKRFAVMGGVRKPGLFPLEEGETVLDAFAAAGGPSTKETRMNEAWLLRRNSKVEGGLEIIKLDLAKLVKKGQGTLNLTLKPYDVLYVPTKPTINLQTVLHDLSPFWWLFR